MSRPVAMNRLATVTAILVAASLLAGCAQSQNQEWFYDQPFPSTRADLYHQYGVPDAIRIEGEDRWLRYDHSKAKGMTLGARYAVVGLIIGRSQSQGDRLWVRVAPDERIVEVLPAVNSDDLEYRLWPFGD